MFKQIENIFFKFLWNNKSEKVSREHAKLPEKLGGLNFPDVEIFWLSFKFSWLRRLLTTSAFWPQILLDQVAKIHNNPLNPSQLLELGPTLLNNISKKISNKFWQQVLSSTIKISEGAIFSFPEKLGASSFWYNPFIRRNNKVVIPAIFPEIAGHVTTLSDFFYPCTNRIMEKNDFCARFGLEIDENKFIDLRYIITLALQKLKYPREKITPAAQPFKPLLIDIALSSKKGCSVYYKLLMKSKTLSKNMSEREQKWHTELNSRYSITFWDKARKLCASISNENPIKWLQFRILRNCLQTNAIVSHFINNVNPECQYCQLSTETISHLYWLCPVVSAFLNDIFNFISSTGLTFAPSREQFLFGYLDRSFNAPENYLVLLLKKFIWSCKFKCLRNLSIVGFKNYLAYALCDLKSLYLLKNKAAEFNVWNDLFVLLPVGAQQEHDGLPATQVHALLLPPAPP